MSSPDVLTRFPRVQLLEGPTPIQRLARLEQEFSDLELALMAPIRGPASLR